jgi:ribosome-associated toxin RatA of RatAB toxin-antitoxin module
VGLYGLVVESQWHTEVVQAPLGVCFDTIVDFERYPEWFSGITDARILERGERTWTVRYELNMLVKTITYTLAYTSTGPTNLEWKFVEGDVNDIVGKYTLTELEPGIVEAECMQSIDIGFWIPGPIKRGFEKNALHDSVREFKAAAEANAGDTA